MMEADVFIPSSPPSDDNSNAVARNAQVKNGNNKRGWKFDNPCLMCKKGTSKIVGNAEVPCTCGGKPAKKRSITAEAFNPFSLAATAPSFVPPTKLVEPEDPKPEPIVHEHTPQMVLHLARQPLPFAQHNNTGYHSPNQRPLSSFARPIPPMQTMRMHPYQQQQQQAQQQMSFQQQFFSPQQQPQQFSPPISPAPAPVVAPSNPPARMGAVLHNILDEMKQLSLLTQQLKEEHNSFVSQVERLKRKNKDMQYLIDVGTEPLAAFAQVNRGDNDLTSADVISLMREKAETQSKTTPIDIYANLITPFIVTDAAKPFMVMRPANLSLSAREVSQICELKKLDKNAKDKLRVNRVAVNDAFCKLVNFEKDDLLQTKDARKIFRSKHKKHFFVPVAPYLFRPSETMVSPVLTFEPRFRTKDGAILFTSSKMQIFYNEAGSVSFFIVCVEAVTKTHVPGYLQIQQRQRAKHSQNYTLQVQQQQQQQQQRQPQQQQQAAPLFKLMKLGTAYNSTYAEQREHDDIFRNDDDELDEEEEAFLNGASMYPPGYYIPQQQQQQQISFTFDSPVGSPVSSPTTLAGATNNNNMLNINSNNNNPFDPPASPLVGGCISVGTLREFETEEAAEDYSWLLNQTTPDSFNLAF